MMDISRLSIYASIFFLLVFAVSVHASSIVLPIINQDEFQSCIWEWCQTVAPAFLFTDINLTFANYSYISVYSNETNYSLTANYSSYANQSQYCYYVDNDTEREGFVNMTNDSYYLASNPSGFISGYTESDPLWSGNYSSVAFSANQGDWNVNNSNTSDYCSNVLGGAVYNFGANNFNGSGNFTTFGEIDADIFRGNTLSTTTGRYYSIFADGFVSSPSFYGIYFNGTSNDSNFFGGQRGDYFWNITGGIPYNNLTLTGSIVKGDLATAFSINLGNISGGSVANNWNMSFYNQSYYLSSASVPTCTKYYNVSTLIWCDCFNTTHKWMANKC